MKYTISSDQHAHNWSAFSSTLNTGINSRLQIILDELKRQARQTIADGSLTMFLAGDLFHVRGQVSPEVLNPVIATIREITEMGITIYAIAGNHDLSGRESSWLGNAMQALDEIDGFQAIVEPKVVHMDRDVVLIPWIQNLDELRKVAKSMARHDRDLIIHAPLNGVIMGIPDHGLDGPEVASWGYDRVFCGHYHNHVEVVPNVYSIGATTHQTWGDVGSLAGFISVSDEGVVHHESKAPKFVELTDPDDLDQVSGNYVRLQVEVEDMAEADQMRGELTLAGARGVLVKPLVKPKSTTATRVTAAALSSLEGSVSAYVSARYPGNAALEALCLDILNETQEV